MREWPLGGSGAPITLLQHPLASGSPLGTLWRDGRQSMQHTYVPTPMLSLLPCRLVEEFGVHKVSEPQAACTGSGAGIARACTCAVCACGDAEHTCSQQPTRDVPSIVPFTPRRLRRQGMRISAVPASSAPPTRTASSMCWSVGRMGGWRIGGQVAMLRLMMYVCPAPYRTHRAPISRCVSLA